MLYLPLITISLHGDPFISLQQQCWVAHSDGLCCTGECLFLQQSCHHYAQQKENSRYPQLEVILGGEKDQQKTTMWGKEWRLVPCIFSPHINKPDQIFSEPHTMQTISLTPWEPSVPFCTQICNVIVNQIFMIHEVLIAVFLWISGSLTSSRIH